MKIQNERYELTFDAKGGEMSSFTDKETGIQYLYQGDSKFWGGKNPALFPMIGNTFDGTYEIEGKRYEMKNHGLVRYANLTCIHNDETNITFELKDSDETRAQYPFAFVYHVSYQLVENKVSIVYEIANSSSQDMPFTFGLHPAFLCPIEKGETFEDYHLKFSNPESLQQLLFDPKKEKDVIYKDVQVQDIPLTYDWITNDATIVYQGMKSAQVSLVGKQHGVHVSIAGYPYLAFWTPAKGAPFLCIEPWYGHGDFTKVDQDFYHREGTMMLSAGKTFTTSYSIEVF